MIASISSNRPEALVEALAARLREGLGPAGLLGERCVVLVPGAAAARWLRFALARRLGISINLATLRLGELLEEALAEEGARRVQLLDREALQVQLVGLLDPEALDLRCEAAPRDYLRDHRWAGGEAPAPRDAAAERDALERRRVQLAGKLATLFDGYAHDRPPVIAAWEQDQPAPLPAGALQLGSEAWQRSLWRRVFGPAGVLSRLQAEQETEWLPLWRAAARLESGAGELPPRVFAFALGPLTRLERRILIAWGARAEVVLLELEATASFASDLPAELIPEAGALPARGGGASGSSELEGLARWTRPARAHAAALAQEAGDRLTAQGAFVAPDRDRRLGWLQRDLLLGRAPELPTPGEQAGPATDDDGSLRVLVSHGIRREVEAVASEIWSLLRADDAERAPGAPPLRLDDLAVALPAEGVDAYLAHVEAVFGEAHELPFNARGQSAASGSRIVEAALLLLELPSGDCSRDRLLRLMTHPAVLAAVPEVDPQHWLAWAEELTILRGRDRSDLEGTYVDRDLFSWDQALRRLALGVSLAPAEGDQVEPVRWGEERYLPCAGASSNAASAAAFVALARSLLEDVSFARGAARPVAEWARFLRGLLEAYLTAGDEDEGLALARCGYALRSLEELDPAGELVLSYRAVAELARARLGEVGVGRGRLLAGGVTVAPLRYLRAVPFRVVFVLGLGEDFAAGAPRDALDLRLAAPEATDVSPSDRDPLALAEVLATTSDRVILSYVGRDEQTGDVLEPSPLLRELEHHLERRGLGLPAVSHRLRRYEEAPASSGSAPGAAPPALPEAAREARARALGRSLREHLEAELPEGATAPVGLERLRALAPAARAALATELAVCAPPDADPLPRTGETVRVSLSALRQFLLCPLQAWAQYRLHLSRDRAGDLLAREDEVFAPSALTRAVFLGEVLWAGLAGAESEDELGAALEQAYDQALERAVLGGSYPTGIFLRAERAADLAILAAWRANLARVQPLARLAARRVRFGAAHAGEDTALPPLGLEVELGTSEAPRPIRVELTGTTRHLLPDASAPTRSHPLGRGLVRLRVGGAKTSHYVEHFLDYALLLAAEVPLAQGAFPLLVIPSYAIDRGKDLWHRRLVQPLDRQAARAWLQTLLRDYLGGSHEYLLPLDAVEAHDKERREAAKTGAPARPLAAIVEALRDPRQASFGGSIQSDWGPIPFARRYRAPADAEAVAARRWGPFFERTRNAKWGQP